MPFDRLVAKTLAASLNFPPNCMELKNIGWAPGGGGRGARARGTPPRS